MKSTSRVFKTLLGFVIAEISCFLLLALHSTVMAQDIGVVAVSPSDSVVVFDLVTNTVLASVPTGGDRPIGLAVTPDGKTVVVANAYSNSISFINLTSWPPALIDAPLLIDSPCGVEAVAVTSDGRFAVTSHMMCGSAEAKVTSIDIAARVPISQVSIGGAQAFDVAITRDDRKIILNDWHGWNTFNLSPTGVLSGPSEYISSLGQYAQTTIAITPNGRLALATNTQSGTVSVLAIDPSNNVTNTGTIIPTGGIPERSPLLLMEHGPT